MAKDNIDNKEPMAVGEMQPAEEPQLSAKQRWQEGFSKRHADIDPNDEEAYYGAINDDYTAYDEAVAKNKENDESNERIIKMLDENPAIAEVIYAMYNGDNPWKAMATVFGENITELMKDPENEELAKAIIEGQNEYAERVNRSKDLMRQAEENVGPSLDALADVVKERGLSDEQRAAVVALFNEIQEGAVVDKVSRETWEMLANAVAHDEDVEVAATEGEMRGRNERNAIERRRLTGGNNPMSMRGQGGNPTGTRTNNAGPTLPDMRPWYERDNEAQNV